MTAKKKIPPSIQARKTKSRTGCIDCSIKLQCHCKEEHNCAWICSNHGGPENCQSLLCNICWFDHNQSAHNDGTLCTMDFLVFTNGKGMEMNNRRNFDLEIPDDYIKIIGVELTVTTYDGLNQELAMFTTPGGLVIPRKRTRLPYGYDGYYPKITFHSTDGDYTMQDYNGQCPW